MRHHYVPQFLLSTWARNNEDNKIEVFRLDLRGFPSSRHTPKYTGYNINLYALTKEIVAGMEKQAIEKYFLMHVDNRGAIARHKIENDGLSSLTDEERVDWARFLMSLRVRQPEIVQQLRMEASEKLRTILNEKPEEYEELVKEEDPVTLEQWTEQQYPGLIENFGMSFFHELIDNPKYGNKILKMKWWICDFSRIKFDLLLSDNPCIFTSGIDDPDCIIALPISPNKLFLATQSQKIDNFLLNVSLRVLAIRMNESSLNQARVRIYARNRDQIARFIENRREQPE